MAARIRRVNTLALATLFALVLVVGTTISSFAATKVFVWSVSPTSVTGGTSGQVFSVTVTNKTPSATINSFKLTVPSDFPVQSAALSTTSSNPNASASVTFSGQVVKVQALDPTKNNQSVVLDISTDVTNPSGTCGGTSTTTWSAPTTYTGSNLSGATYSDISSGTDQSSHITQITKTCKSLSFSTEPPASVAVGGTFSVTVHASDGASGVSVTLTKASGPGTLSGASSPVSTNGSGDVTFSGLSVNQAGDYTLSATASGYASATSSSVTAKALSFSVQPPASVSVGGTFSATVHASDNVSGISVSVSKASGPGTLAGGGSGTTDGSGDVTFSGLSVNQAGDYTLSASATGYASATSSSITAKALSFTTQPPASAAVGETFSVTVHASDGASGVSVTLSKATGPGNLSGGGSGTTDGSGDATFSGMSFNQAGDYTLSATATGYASATSSPISVGGLSFSTQPTDTLADTDFTVAVHVSDGASGVSVDLSKASGPGTLSGTLTQSTSGSGIATFSGLQLDQTGQYTLSASATGYGSATSNSFKIKGLSFTTQPTDTTQNTAFSVAVTVSDHAPGETVTLAKGSGPGDLDGTLTQATDGSGVATFTGLSIDAAGDYTVQASATGYGSVTSGSFSVTGLSFTVQPSETAANVSISPAVEVTLSDGAPGVAVTISKASGPGALSGTLTQTTDGSGVATFSDLKLDTAGTYTLTAAASGYGNDTSQAFTVGSLSFTQQPSDGARNTDISPAVTVSISPASSGVSVALTIASGPAGAGISGATATTDASGVATFSSLQLDKSGTYTLQATATGYGSDTSSSFRIYDSMIGCGEDPITSDGTTVTLDNPTHDCHVLIDISANHVEFPTVQSADSKFMLSIAWGQPVPAGSDPTVWGDEFVVNGTSFFPNTCDVDGSGNALFPNNPDGSNNFWPAGAAEQPWCVKGSSVALHDFGGSTGWAYQATEAFLGAGDPSITRCSTCK